MAEEIVMHLYKFQTLDLLENSEQIYSTKQENVAEESYTFSDMRSIHEFLPNSHEEMVKYGRGNVDAFI